MISSLMGNFFLLLVILLDLEGFMMHFMEKIEKNLKISGRGTILCGKKYILGVTSLPKILGYFPLGLNAYLIPLFKFKFKEIPK